MRLLFLGLLICISCSLAWSSLLGQTWDNRARFDSFASKFGKTFRSPAERERRYSIFKNNVRAIEEFNRKAEKKGSSVRQGINEFTELTYEEFVSQYTGLRGEEPDVAVLPNGNSSNPDKSPLMKKILTQSAPSSKNWVAEGKVLPVRNQGACGACWAFATVAVVESLNAIRGKPLTPLSEQQLMDCNYDNSRGNWACKGGFFPVAFSYVNYNGIMKRSDYPYSGKLQTCRYASNKAVARTAEYEQIRSEEYLKTVVGTVGPVAVGIYVSDIFQRYASGIIDDPNCMNKAPNHGVVVVGYGTDRGRDYWMVRNSWGPSWGESGYFRMARGKNMCNILKMAYYADF